MAKKYKKKQNSDFTIIKQKPLGKKISKALGIAPINDLVINKSTLTQKWEDLYNIYNDLSSHMVELSKQVAQVLNSLKASGTPIPSEVAIASKALYKDLENMTTDLLAIRSKHDGKVGVVKDDQELSDLLECFNMYYLLFDRFKALTFQELLIITEHTMTLKKELAETIKAEEQTTNTTETLES